MICDRVQLCLCRGNRLPIRILDFIASAILLEASSDSNAVAIGVGLVRLVTSVLESDRDLRRPGHLRQSISASLNDTHDAYVSPDFMNDFRP